MQLPRLQYYPRFSKTQNFHPRKKIYDQRRLGFRLIAKNDSFESSRFSKFGSLESERGQPHGVQYLVLHVTDSEFAGQYFLWKDLVFESLRHSIVPKQSSATALSKVSLTSQLLYSSINPFGLYDTNI